MRRLHLAAFFTMTALAGEVTLLYGAPTNSSGGITKPVLAAEAGLTTNIAAAVTNSVLALPEALSLALMNNPNLAVYSMEQRAADARRIQAGLLPNPEFEVSMENLGGPSSQEGFEGPVAKFSIGQLIELGGKRSARRLVAQNEQTLTGWDYEGKRLDILSETTILFVQTLAAQNKLALAQSVFELAEDTLQTVSRRVAAGRDSPLEEKKASVETVNARIAAERAQREWDKSRKNLAVMWGQFQPIFGRLEGNLNYVVTQLPEWKRLRSFLANNPDIARWEDELALRRAALQQAKAAVWPDVTIQAGIDHFRDTGTESYRAGAAVPLPLFNRNQGGIREAAANLEKSNNNRAAAFLSVERELFAAFQEINALHKEITALKTEVLPVARDVFDSVRAGYQQGKFSYLEVLDAQRTLFEAENRNIETLVNYHFIRSQIERLIGKDLEKI